MSPWRPSRPVLRLLCMTTLAAATVLPARSASGQETTATRLSATPSALTLRVGQTGTVQVVAYDAAGNAVEAPVRLLGPWRELEVDGNEVRALQVGEHELLAVLARGAGEDPLELRIPVTATWPAVTQAEVVPGVGRLYAGTTLRHTATAHHADGTERPEPLVTWRSSGVAVATVDDFGNVTAVAPGRVRITAEIEGIRGEVTHDVAPLPATALRLEGGEPPTGEIRTGDVVSFRAVADDDRGNEVADVPVTWGHTYRATAWENTAPTAAARLEEGRFVADVPGVHTVMVSAGPLTARRTFRVAPRDVVKELQVEGHGLVGRYRTTDFWVFEGRDGRDYVLTGSKLADGHAFVYDVTDPANIVKTDSVQVDARTVNDVKVSPDARYATMTREGASDRRNGVVILDLADPAHPVIASQITDRLTGGVHNAFPTNTHVFALSNGDKYVIIDVADLYDPRIVSEYDHPNSRVHDVWVHDGLAFSAEWETGIVVVDVGNGRWGGSIENPVLVSEYPLPTGGTHAVFPYYQESTGKY